MIKICLTASVLVVFLIASVIDCFAGAALFQNTTDTIQVSGAINLGTAATYEARVKFTSNDAVGIIFRDLVFGAEDKSLEVISGTNYAYAYPVNAGYGITGTNILNTNEWYFIAYVYDGAEERLYLDGSLIASRPGSGPIANAGGTLFLGATPDSTYPGGVDPSFLGYIDTLRISNIARYSDTNFSAPTGDLTPDGDTLLLYNFNETPRSTTVTDLSGNGHDGTLGAGFGGATAPQLGYYNGSVTVDVTVDGASGPWLWASNGLNAAFPYGLNDQEVPTVVSASDGIDFSPGNVLQIQYVSGLVYEGGGWPLNDANGAIWFGPVNDATNSDGFPFFPSYYFNHTDYPAYAAELIGTFTDDSGAIVGTPFNVGDFRYVTVPVGATRLQLGDLDTEFSDNSGSWQIQVSEIPRLEIISAGQIVLHAPAGSTNRIEYTSDFTDTNWQTMTNVVVQRSPLEIVDPEFGHAPRRFYRAALLP
jgi:hypothetical protein